MWKRQRVTRYCTRLLHRVLRRVSNYLYAHTARNTIKICNNSLSFDILMNGRTVVCFPSFPFTQFSSPFVFCSHRFYMAEKKQEDVIQQRRKHRALFVPPPEREAFHSRSAGKDSLPSTGLSNLNFVLFRELLRSPTGIKYQFV